MFIQSLKEIKRLRKKHGLSQKELALLADVSQSLLAKIEMGKVEPTFSKAQKIFEALSVIEEKNEKKAIDLMNKKVFFSKVDDSIKETIKTMKNKGISQMPVLSKEKICGLISEGIILEKAADNLEQIETLTVGELMEESPPIVSLKTGQKSLLQLLKDYSLILVAEKGEIKGVISKTDLLKTVS